MSIDRDRLAKLLGMMGSACDGEALNAARKAERLRSEAGLTWHDIIVPNSPATRSRLPRPESTAEAIEFVLTHKTVLTNWELAFVRSIAKACYPLRPKQVALLQRLVEKARCAAAAA